MPVACDVWKGGGDVFGWDEGRTVPQTDVTLMHDVEHARWYLWLMEAESAMTMDADAGVPPTESHARTHYLARVACLQLLVRSALREGER
jgi:hypothetical protein